jgi:Predicted drug exporters of the RND superfamily
VIALTGMLLVPSNVMKSLAVGAISVGIVSVLAALTLLPALLGKLGDHVNSLRVPFIGRNIGSGGEGRFWGGVVRAVMRHPVVYLVTFSALLIALAIPTLGLNLGASGVSTLPNRLESKKGYEALNRYFPQASASPALIAVEGNVRSPQVRAAIAGCGTSSAPTRSSAAATCASPPTDSSRRSASRSAATRPDHGRWRRSGTYARR